MVSSINGNIAAGLAQRNIGVASTHAASSIARLSSGNRIVQSSDDVAGLSVGTSLRTQVTTLRTALTNASQGNSLLQVADGALSQIVDILQRQKAIATQAGSGSIGDTERAYLNQEFQGLAQQIDQITGSTNFNGVKLLNGGLGTTTSLVNLDSLAAAAVVPGTASGSNTTSAATSTTAIEAFNIKTGATNKGTAAAGTLDITDSSGGVLADASYLSVNSALIGQFTSFKLSNVIYGGSATLTATINGVDFSGSITDGATTGLLKNGNTYINLGFTAIDLTDAGTTNVSQAQVGKDFADTVIQRVSLVNGVDFAGTRLAGAVGNAAYGIGTTRLSSNNAVISNFQYVGNTSAADTSTLSVQINGKTFTASGVKDAVASAAGKIVFASDDSQIFTVDLTGLTTDFTDIRTDQVQQKSFISALNQGFSRAGAGLNFALGSSASDSISVSLQSASTSNLYNGQSLDVASAPSAAAASLAIDKALQTVTSIRAQVGALESRFNFASANLESSVQNQDAARGSLLDTDVSSESTSYATAQVQLQAGIAVLAQANQLPQNLLKLIQ